MAKRTYPAYYNQALRDSLQARQELEEVEEHLSHAQSALARLPSGSAFDAIYDMIDKARLKVEHELKTRHGKGKF